MNRITNGTVIRIRVSHKQKEIHNELAVVTSVRNAPSGYTVCLQSDTIKPFLRYVEDGDFDIIWMSTRRRHEEVEF